MATWSLRLNEREERALSCIAAKFGARGLTKAETVRLIILQVALQDPGIAAFMAAYEAAPVEAREPVIA
jgi:hypothetical protein